MSAPETDLDKAIAALRLLRDTCSAAIDALQQPFSSAQAALLPSRPTRAVLHKDFQSLLTLIYTSTTKVTLVLRPSAPAPRAAIAPITDLATSITSLAACAALFDLHGSTLASEARLFSRDVCEAVRALATEFVENTGEDYLVRTGAVHDMVEKGRRELPTDNVSAVKKRWRADRDMMADCVEEIGGMLEDAGQEEEGDGDLDGEMDEWDELGFGSSKKMSEVELERTRKVQPLVRFITLYHKRVVPDILGGLSGTVWSSEAMNRVLDTLPPLSNAVVLGLEEVVANLYAPQKPAALAAAVSSFVEAISKVHESITNDVFLPPLEQPGDLAKEMGTLSIDGMKSSEEKKTKDVRKWFSSCLAQIHKSAKSVDELLAAQVINDT